jgi:hypothetical protein
MVPRAHPSVTAYEKWQRMNHDVKPGIRFVGGSGDSREDAIIIKNAANHRAGVDAEYLYLQKRFGARDSHWRLVFQMLLKGEKPMDRLSIELTGGTIKDIYFDVSEFFGKG